MNINELFSKTEIELKRLQKSTLIQAIYSNRYNHEYNERRLKELAKEIELSKAPYNQAKQMLIGATGYNAPVDEYSKKVNLDDVDLCFLIGLLMSQRKEV